MAFDTQAVLQNHSDIHYYHELKKHRQHFISTCISLIRVGLTIHICDLILCPLFQVDRHLSSLAIIY